MEELIDGPASQKYSTQTPAAYVANSRTRRRLVLKIEIARNFWMPSKQRENS